MDKFTSTEYTSSEFHIWFGSQHADTSQVIPGIIHGASGGKKGNMGTLRALQVTHFKLLQKKYRRRQFKKKKIKNQALNSTKSIQMLP